MENVKLTIEEIITLIKQRDFTKIREIFEEYPNIDIADALNELDVEDGDEFKYIVYLFKVVVMIFGIVYVAVLGVYYSLGSSGFFSESIYVAFVIKISVAFNGKILFIITESVTAVALAFRYLLYASASPSQLSGFFLCNVVGWQSAVFHKIIHNLTLNKLNL